MSTHAISVQDLKKSYGDFEAVRGVSFEVPEGQVFGLLGPNGAGKTTTVEILEGLRARTSGSVSVLGFDPGVNVLAIKDRIGASLQATNLPDKITTREAIDLFASFYSKRTDSNKLLKRLQLEDKTNAEYRQLSGGQKQRLALALALVNEPSLLFLDEPTTGLDPQVRLEIHKLIQELKSDRRTIVLTTHYIEEAERLCDQVAIIDAGRIIASGSPQQLQAQAIAKSRVEIHLSAPMPEGDPPASPDVGVVSFGPDRKSMIAACGRPGRAVADLLRWVDQAGIEVEDIRLERPTLEDVFIELTGKRLRE